METIALGIQLIIIVACMTSRMVALNPMFNAATVMVETIMEASQDITGGPIVLMLPVTWKVLWHYLRLLFIHGCPVCRIGIPSVWILNILLNLLKIKENKKKQV